MKGNCACSIVHFQPAYRAGSLSQLGWLNIREMIDFETATMVNKSLHRLAPLYMQDMFHKLSDCRKRVLRSTETDP